MQASEQQRKYGRPAVRHAASAAFLALAIACTAAGLSYWRASFINVADRPGSRELIAEAGAPALMEYTLSLRYLTACVDVMSHWTFTVEPAADRRLVTQRCTEMADAQRRQSGPSAEGEMVFALAARGDGNSGRALSHIRKSQELAPRDLWNTIKRVELVLALVPKDELADLRDYFGGEFAILTGSNLGVNTAVALYAKYPSIRAALLDISGEMSPSDRLRFLNRVKRLAGG